MKGYCDFCKQRIDPVTGCGCVLPTDRERQEVTRDLIERTITAVIEASAISLTAGSVMRLIKRNRVTTPSRSTIQRILDRMVANGEIEKETRTIEKNGFILPARHYRKAR